MNGDDEYTGGWDEWRRLIIHEIKRLNDNLESTNTRFIIMQTDVSKLKLASAIWGAIGGIAITVLFQKAISGI